MEMRRTKKIAFMLAMILAVMPVARAQEEWAVTMETCQLGDIEMRWASFGEGDRAFVILPGLSLKSVVDSVQAIAARYGAFARDYRVYVFDRRSNAPQEYSVRQMAQDTAKVMEHLDISSADVFGASQGGMIAQYLAIDYPHLVHRLVLGSTLSHANETSRAVIGEWVQLAQKGASDELVKTMLESIYAPPTMKKWGDSLAAANGELSQEELERFIIMASACSDFDCSKDLEKICCPVLVIGCWGDQVVTAQASVEIAQQLGCDLFLYQDSYGHGVYDEAEDYVERLMTFFKQP